MRIAVIGAYGVGKTMRVPHFPTPGETVLGREYTAGPGGKGSNQAIAAARLGAHVELLTAVGRDAEGEDAFALWSEEHVGAEHVLQMDSPTMVGFILVDGSGENEIAIAPGALEHLAAEHVEPFRAAARDADLVIVSLEIPVPAACAALRIAHEEGTMTLLNPAPAAALPEEVWSWVDVLVPNETEAAQILGLDADHGLDEMAIVRRLRGATGATIVMTLGSRGCAVLDDGEPYLVAPSTPERVVDTTGAGDTFTAALAIALGDRLPLEDAVRFASAAGAHAVTQHGVLDALPTRDDIDRILAAQPATQALQEGSTP